MRCECVSRALSEVLSKKRREGGRLSEKGKVSGQSMADDPDHFFLSFDRIRCMFSDPCQLYYNN